MKEVASEKPASESTGVSNKLRNRATSKKQSSAKKAKSSRKSARQKREPKVVKTASQKAWEEAKEQILYFFNKHWLITGCGVTAVLLLITLYFAVDVLDGQALPPVTDSVRFDFARNGKPMGSVELGLFGHICPLTTKNFIMLATHKKGFGYKGSKIHCVMKKTAILGGDITNGDGSGGRSALEESIEKESYYLHHTAPGYLGMQFLPNNFNGNRSSLFYITIDQVPGFDGIHVAFGKVLSGLNVVNEIERSEIGPNLMPKDNITITDAVHTKW